VSQSASARAKVSQAIQIQNEETKLNGTLQQRTSSVTPAAPEAFPGAFWCPDLISTRDLGPRGN
jgi:hypothetical protein